MKFSGILWVLLLGGCYAGALRGGTPAQPKRFDAGSCHVQLVDARPANERSVDVGRIHVWADLSLIGEDWALEALATRTCALGGDAMVLLPQVEAMPAVPVARRGGSNWVAYEAEAFHLR